MPRFLKGLAAWLLVCGAFIGVVAAGLAALAFLAVAVPVLALIGRAAASRRTPHGGGSGRVLEGEYRVVDAE